MKKLIDFLKIINSQMSRQARRYKEIAKNKDQSESRICIPTG